MRLGLDDEPNHALQRTRRERRGCNCCVPCAGSLSLGREVKYMNTAKCIGVAAILLVVLPVRTDANDQDSKSVQGRIEIKNHDVCLNVSVFLTNATDKEITIVTGVGGLPRSISPTFLSGGAYLGVAN